MTVVAVGVPSGTSVPSNTLVGAGSVARLRRTATWSRSSAGFVHDSVTDVADTPVSALTPVTCAGGLSVVY